MSNKGFIVIEANQFWTDNMMALTDEGLPKMFFTDIKTAEKYRINLEIEKWKALFSSDNYPKENVIIEDNRHYKIENQLFWVIHYFTLLSYDDFQEIEEKLKEKGFSLTPEISEEGIAIFIEVGEKVLDNFPEFYFVQEVELIED